MTIRYIPLRNKNSKVTEILPAKYLDHPVFGRHLEEVRTDKPLNEVKSAKTLREVTPAGVLEPATEAPVESDDFEIKDTVEKGEHVFTTETPTKKDGK